jgi:hypothetical protein
MTKPCFIGNSHIGCIRKAMARDGSPYKGEVTFAFAPRLLLADCIVEDGAFKGGDLTVATHPQRTREQQTQLGDHGSFVIVGVGLTVRTIAQVYRTHRLTQHDEAGYALISPDCLQTTASEIVKASGAFQIATRIRRETDRPIIIVPEPGLSERVLETGSDDKSTAHIVALAQIMNHELIGEFLYRLFVDAIRKEGERDGIKLVEQPQQTRRRCLTKAEYQNDVSGDVQHANAEYGAKLLREVLAAQH